MIENNLDEYRKYAASQIDAIEHALNADQIAEPLREPAEIRRLILIGVELASNFGISQTSLNDLAAQVTRVEFLEMSRRNGQESKGNTTPVKPVKPKDQELIEEVLKQSADMLGKAAGNLEKRLINRLFK